MKWTQIIKPFPICGHGIGESKAPNRFVGCAANGRVEMGRDLLVLVRDLKEGVAMASPLHAIEGSNEI